MLCFLRVNFTLGGWEGILSGHSGMCKHLSQPHWLSVNKTHVPEHSLSCLWTRSVSHSGTNVLWYSQGHYFLPSSPARRTTGAHTPLNFTATLLHPVSFETCLAASLHSSSSCFLSHHTTLILQHLSVPLSSLESAIFIFSLTPFFSFSAVEDIEELDTRQQDNPTSHRPSYLSLMPSQLTLT